VPDLASDLPDISADGRTCTFRLRSNIHFSNGDRVTASDVIYSWTRAAAKQGDFAYAFEPVLGYDQLVAHQAHALAGLVAADELTLIATLRASTSYWLSELAPPWHGWSTGGLFRPGERTLGGQHLRGW
jgi:ABC-type transport system substrate-binding protein